MQLPTPEAEMSPHAKEALANAVLWMNHLELDDLVIATSIKKLIGKYRLQDSTSVCAPGSNASASKVSEVTAGIGTRTSKIERHRRSGSSEQPVDGQGRSPGAPAKKSYSNSCYAVITPDGRFGSLGEASRALNTTAPTIRAWIDMGKKGWAFSKPRAPLESNRRKDGDKPKRRRKGSLMIETELGLCTINEACELFDLKPSTVYGRASRGNCGWRLKEISGGASTTEAHEKPPVAPSGNYIGVQTPGGVFRSVEEAAAFLNKGVNTVTDLIQRGTKGFKWLEFDSEGNVLGELPLGQSLNGAINSHGLLTSVSASSSRSSLRPKGLAAL